MADNQKTERAGFGVTPAAIQKKEVSPAHPAWPTWLQTNQPAPKSADGVEYLSTAQVLERLNNIMAYDYCEEKDVFDLLLANEFEVLKPVIDGVHLWIVKPVMV